jgi:hypothetical protein
VAGGLALVAAGMLLMLIAGPHSSWVVTLPGSLLAATGTGLFNPAMSGMGLTAAPSEMSGLAAGVNDTARQAGIAVGIAGLGALIPTYSVHPHSIAYARGLHHALLVCGVVAGLGALGVWRLTRSRAGVETAPDAAPARSVA